MNGSREYANALRVPTSEFFFICASRPGFVLKMVLPLTTLAPSDAIASRVFAAAAMKKLIEKEIAW